MIFVICTIFVFFVKRVANFNISMILLHVVNVVVLCYVSVIVFYNFVWFYVICYDFLLFSMLIYDYVCFSIVFYYVL